MSTQIPALVLSSSLNDPIETNSLKCDLWELKALLHMKNTGLGSEDHIHERISEICKRNNLPMPEAWRSQELKNENDKIVGSRLLTRERNSNADIARPGMPTDPVVKYDLFIAEAKTLQMQLKHAASDTLRGQLGNKMMLLCEEFGYNPCMENHPRLQEAV